MPVLHVGRDDDDIASMNDLNRAALHLDASRASGDDEYLTKGMRMPCAASTRGEGHDTGGHPRRSVRRK